MSNIQLQSSNYEEFVLKSDFASSLILTKEPDGWDEETIKLTRHKDYHGIFISYTGQLKFFDEAKDYILNAYELGGINAVLRLTRYVLKDVDGDVKMVEDYSVVADYLTMKLEENSLEINFNSNELEEIIKSHESDTFEIERLESIDNNPIEPLELYKIALSGRVLSGVGENNVNLDVFSEKVGAIDVQKRELYRQSKNKLTTVIQKQISKAIERHVTADSFDGNIDSSQAFIVRSDDSNEGTMNAIIDYDCEFYATSFATRCRVNVNLRKYEWDGSSLNEIWHEQLYDSAIQMPDEPVNLHKFSGTKKVSLEWNQSLSLTYHLYDGNSFLDNWVWIFFKKEAVKVSVDSFYEASQDISFSFMHDIIDRLMYIITGEKERFYSNYFGRTELNEKGNYGYIDGEGGLIGALSGFWARAFDPLSEKYKSLQISLKDVIKSCQAVFNVGVGIETHNLKQRLRIERLEHFYRNEVVVKLPYQVTDVRRTVDKELFFSGTDFGYEHGGNYDEQVGLDEPNTRTKTVTPIRKSDKKYMAVSKIRSDETGLELVRKKPQALYPDDDTGQDEHNWLLDLKRGSLYGYEQKIWSDRLKEIPQGVNFPENYKSMFFTPLRMMLRHGFILRAGMEPYLNQFINYANSEDNTNLKTHAKDDWNLGLDEPVKENDNILVSKLSRSRFLPEEIEFNHPVDTALMDLIRGTKPVLINGKYENIPNVYFKFEFINEKEVIETGYLLELTPGSNGKFKIQKANENII